jgi:palmitoyl transferase
MAALGVGLPVQSSAQAPPIDSSAPQSAQPGDAAPTTWWQGVEANMADTWQSKKYELYIPLHTWHNRADYTGEQISGYNETPWGLGAGTYIFDKDGDWHAWYAMAFLDSHSRVEPIAGYGYQKIWRPAGEWRLGAGFTTGFTARADYHYYPIPIVLPLVSIGYGRVALQTTYIPGGQGYGNVLFTWLRWEF